MKYILVKEDGYMAFIKVVEKWISLGYKPVGGVCVTVSDNDYGRTYCQSFIKD